MVSFGTSQLETLTEHGNWRGDLTESMGIGRCIIHFQPEERMSSRNAGLCLGGIKAGRSPRHRLIAASVSRVRQG